MMFPTSSLMLLASGLGVVAGLNLQSSAVPNAHQAAGNEDENMTLLCENVAAGSSANGTGLDGMFAPDAKQLGYSEKASVEQSPGPVYDLSNHERIERKAKWVACKLICGLVSWLGFVFLMGVVVIPLLVGTPIVFHTWTIFD